MTDHESYERLCTLAATGQLTAFEQTKFDEHCNQCTACRHQLEDLTFIGSQLHLDAAMHVHSGPMAAGSLERFRARAIQEGIALRSAPAGPLPHYKMAMAAAFLFIAALVFAPKARRAPQNQAISAVVPYRIHQSFSESTATSKPSPRTTKVFHARIVQHKFISRADQAVNEPHLGARQFPQVIAASNSFFRLEGPANSSPNSYPELRRSHTFHLALFPQLTDSSTMSLASIGGFNRPADNPLTGKSFDFTTNIRQIYFQPPIVQ
jgi:hypothetical protein